MWYSHCATRGIENGSESQTRHDWQRRPAITGATTDLEIVDLSRTMSTPSAHWALPQSPAAKKLGLGHLWETRLGASLLVFTQAKPPLPGPFISSSPTLEEEEAAMHASRLRRLVGAANGVAGCSWRAHRIFGPLWVEALTTTIFRH